MEPLEQRAMLSAGDVLATTITDFNGQLDRGGLIAAIGSNKLIQVGITINSSTNEPEFALAQFDAAGDLDTSFGTNDLDGIDGQTTAPLPDDPAYDNYAIWEINGVAVDSSNRIVVVGTANEQVEADFDYMVARFNSDGTLDGSFGIGGVVVTDQIPAPVSNAQSNSGRAVAIEHHLSGDKIVVAGSFSSYNSESFGVIRYLDDGSPDPSFNGGNIAATPFDSTLDLSNNVITTQDQVRAVAIDGDGKIVLAGSTFDPLAVVPAFQFGVQRYNSNGSIDTSFSTDGMVATTINSTINLDIAYAVAADSAGNYVFGGTTLSDFSIDFAIVRYDNTGTPDITFGDSGVVVTPAGFGNSGQLDSLALQADGKIVIGGTIFDNNSSVSLIVGRYETDGSLDGDFGIVTSYTFVGAPDSNRSTIAFVTDESTDTDEIALGNWVPGAGNGDFILQLLDRGNVVNTPPTVAPISGPTSGVRNFSQTFSSSFSDPDADSWTVTWNFGDSNSTSGSASPGAISASHIYTANGTYSVSVTVDDGTDAVLVNSFTITISSSSNSGGVLQIAGNGGNDVIQVKNNTFLNVTVNGTTTNYTGVNTVMIAGGAGNDDIKVNPNVTQNTVIFGGAGNDSIKGGGGNDILVGGDGDDLIDGQDGRDILIGSDGADRLVGNKDDDILVAGYTSYDSDANSLLAVLSEWTSGRTYTQRVNNVMGTSPGTRNNGTTYLKPYDSVANNSDATVFDDQDADILTGSQGQDLFLFNADTSGHDTITDLSASEFAADIDWLLTP